MFAKHHFPPHIVHIPDPLTTGGMTHQFGILHRQPLGFFDSDSLARFQDRLSFQ